MDEAAGPEDSSTRPTPAPSAPPQVRRGAFPTPASEIEKAERFVAEPEPRGEPSVPEESTGSDNDQIFPASDDS